MIPGPTARRLDFRQALERLLALPAVPSLNGVSATETFFGQGLEHGFGQGAASDQPLQPTAKLAATAYD